MNRPTRIAICSTSRERDSDCFPLRSREIATRVTLTVLFIAAFLLFAAGARADFVPGPCTGGPAGTICAPGEWTQPGDVQSSQPLFSVEERTDDFPSNSGSWVVTFWFRSDVPGMPDQGYEYTVNDWLNVDNGVITPPVPTGHNYTVWATVDRNDGQGSSLLDVTTDSSGGSWGETVTVSNPDPNQVGGPSATLCVAAADNAQVQAGLAPGCAI